MNEERFAVVYQINLFGNQRHKVRFFESIRQCYRFVKELEGLIKGTSHPELTFKIVTAHNADHEGSNVHH